MLDDQYPLVGGIPTPLKNMKVSWDDYSQFMEKKKMFQTTNQSPYICWFWWLNPLVIVILPLKSTTNSTILGAPLTSSHSSQQGPMLSVREGWIGWICFLRCQFGVVMRYTQKSPNKWLPLNDLCTCKNAYIYIYIYICVCIHVYLYKYNQIYVYKLKFKCAHMFE